MDMSSKRLKLAGVLVFIFAALTCAFDNSFGEPLTQELIRQAQRKLGLTPDGRVGEKSRAAIIAFQKGRGLPPTGELDSETLAKLGLASSLPAIAPADVGPGIPDVRRTTPSETIAPSIDKLVAAAETLRLEFQTLRQALTVLQWILIAATSVLTLLATALTLTLLRRGKGSISIIPAIEQVSLEIQELRSQLNNLIKEIPTASDGIRANAYQLTEILQANVHHFKQSFRESMEVLASAISDLRSSAPPPEGSGAGRIIQTNLARPPEAAPGTPRTAEARWNELFGRVLSQRPEINQVLRETEDRVEAWLLQCFGDLEVGIKWPTPFLCTLGVRGYSKGLALPRAGAHLQLPWRDWFHLPYGINVGISGTIRPAILEGWNTLDPRLVQQGEVEQG